MVQKTLIPLLILTTFLASSALASSSALQIRDLIIRYPKWQTYAYDSKLGINFSGTNKLWRVSQISKNLRLIEESETTLKLSIPTGINPDMKNIGQYLSWIRTETSMDENFEFNSFTVDFESILEKPTKIGLAQVSIEILNQNSFKVTSVGNKIAVLFFQPMEIIPEAQIIPIDHRVNLYTAPIGITSSMFANLGIKIPAYAYVHQNLKRKKIVLLDRTFPSKFLGEVEKSINKWNIELGANVFSVEKSPRNIDPQVCLVSEVLCLRWSGPQNVPWAGMGATTTLSFQPLTGEVHGGFIDFQIPEQATSLSVVPPALLNRLKSKMNIDEIVELFTQREQFLNYENDEPSGQLQFFLMHEIGHFNGFEHNFYGSLMGSADVPSLSIMDYPPFPTYANEALGNLHRFDREMLALMYDGILPSSDYSTCADFDSYPLFQKLTGKGKPAACNVFDIGDSANWFVNQASHHPLKVFGSSNYMTGENILDLLLPFTLEGAPGEAKNVQTYLCASPKHMEIDAYSTKKGYKLSCPRFP